MDGIQALALLDGRERRDDLVDLRANDIARRVLLVAEARARSEGPHGGHGHRNKHTRRDKEAPFVDPLSPWTVD